MTDGVRLAEEALRAFAVEDRRVAAMRDTMLRALPTARDAGLSTDELSTAWGIDPVLIRRATDEYRRRTR